MKHLKTFENYRQYKKVDEDLKSVVTSALFGLSTLLSTPAKSQTDMMDPSNPIGLTSPISPLSPSNPNSVYYTQDDGPSRYSINQAQILSELDNIDINDTTLIKVKSLVEKGPESKEEFNDILGLLREFAQSKGYTDLLPIIQDISDIDITIEYGDNTRYNLTMIIDNLKDMRDDAHTNDIMMWICISLLVVTLLMVVGMLVTA